MLTDFLYYLIAIFYTETRGITLESVLLVFMIESIIIIWMYGILKKKAVVSRRKLFYCFLLAAYIAFILAVTILRREDGSRDGIVHLHLVLGSGIKSGHPSVQIMIYVLYNILLFIPMGILVYLIAYANNRRAAFIIATAISGMGSLAIEFLQLVTGRGMFEVTDLLTNTFGGVLGTALAAFVLKIIFRRKR